MSVASVLTIEFASDDDFLPYGNAYIAASYVKFIEVRLGYDLEGTVLTLQSAGARVVPIFYNATQEQLGALLTSINGAHRSTTPS